MNLPEREVRRRYRLLLMVSMRIALARAEYDKCESQEAAEEGALALREMIDLLHQWKLLEYANDGQG